MRRVLKFVFGGAMGFVMGMGVMMMPAGRAIRRDVHHGMSYVRRWLREM